MSTPLLPDLVPETDANPVSFYWGRGGGRSAGQVVMDVDDNFIFDRCITNTWGLGTFQNTENEANLLLPLGIQKLKGFQLQGLRPLNP